VSYGGDLENIILGVIERWAGGRYSERHAIVSSYDPVNHLAKATLQPEGQETGWLPIETSHIGSSYGIVIGLQPGQAGVNNQGQGGQTGPQSSNQGDQVIIRLQEGDIESGKIAGRVHSESDNPPQVQSGEIMIYTRFQKSDGSSPDAAQGGQGGTGQQLYLKNDGSITWTDGNGASIAFDGQGNCTLNCKNFTATVNGDMATTVSGKRSDNVSKTWVSQAAGGVWNWLTAGSAPSGD
jgi:hypothetical protein